MQIDSEKLKQLRAKKGIRQKSLAHLIGVSQGMVSLLEVGNRNISPKTAEKLAHILACDVKDFTANGEQTPYMQIVKLADRLTEERQRIVLRVIKEFLF